MSAACTVGVFGPEEGRRCLALFMVSLCDAMSAVSERMPMSAESLPLLSIQPCLPHSTLSLIHLPADHAIVSLKELKYSAHSLNQRRTRTDHHHVDGDGRERAPEGKDGGSEGDKR